MIRRLIILLLIVGMMFAQDSNIDSTLYFYKSGDKLHFGYNSPKKTSLNVNEFVAIYYDDGSMSTYDNTETTCSISFGVNLEKKYLLVDCHMFANGDSENIINVEHIDRMVKRDGEIITGKKIRKTFNMIRIVGTSTIYIFAGGIILSLVLLV